jgi:DNA-binding winged helix-turn-helix (wHTH) protein
MVASRQYEFGQYRLDTEARLLFRKGERVVLTPKAVDLLIALVAAEGRPIGKQDLLQKVWPDAVVEEGSLTSHISLLRKTLGQGHDEPQFIETIPKRGYRFVCPLIQIPGSTADAGAGRMMLVVLPFENLSGGEKHDYFSEGLTEEMITQLARLSPDRLGVIARTSAMQYRSTNKSVHSSSESVMRPICGRRPTSAACTTSWHYRAKWRVRSRVKYRSNSPCTSRSAWTAPLPLIRTRTRRI